MNNTVDKEETQDQDKPNLKLITGGKGFDENWLANLPVNSVFLTSPKFDNYGKINTGEGLILLQIVAKTEKATRLMDLISRQQFMVKTRVFSMRMEKFEDLGIVNYADADQLEDPTL